MGASNRPLFGVKMRCKLLQLICFVALAATIAAAQDAKAAPAQPGAEYSGMYNFLRDGEFVQITVEDEGNVTGFISRFGDETYNAEVSLILAKLQHAETEQEIKDIVIKVFSHYRYFDPSSLDSSLDLSAKLMEVKKIICP